MQMNYSLQVIVFKNVLLLPIRSSENTEIQKIQMNKSQNILTMEYYIVTKRTKTELYVLKCKDRHENHYDHHNKGARY